MKMRSKKSLQEYDLEERFRASQTRMLNVLPHRGVVRYHEMLEDDKFYYIIMERASEGSFFRSLLKDFGGGSMPAPAVKQLMWDILEAVSHIHRQGILHRDIKPDNIAMDTSGGGACGRPEGAKRVVLIDFDHMDPDWDPDAKAVKEQKRFGTLRFNAPEAMLGHFSPQSDLYSVGTILYLLMVGRFPFDDDVYAGGFHAKTYRRMEEARVDFQGDPWLEQPECRDLCRQLLAFEQHRRPASADEALQHAWFRTTWDNA
mmetsp:Transcript_12233/g.34617  ORF Transcript_12233/g.34617 Transcript_12233/m.34617 type:complete len:259 (-) Transcript_12233:40-816(-)